MNEKIRHLREQMKRLNLEGMIVSNPISIKYLTNIEAEGTLLITRKENIFITYAMYMEYVNSTLTINDEVIVVDIKDVSKDEFENFFLFCENVGFEEKYVTYAEYKRIYQKYKVHNLVETEGIIEKQRMIKDNDEIEQIKKACEITDNCFSHLLTFIKKDMTEKQVANEIERYFKENGADGLAFDTIVAFGENTSKPHWNPSDRKIETGEPILIDMGCKYKGYCSDMTRTIFLGCILEEYKPYYDTILKNEILSFDQIKDGVSVKKVAEIIDENLKRNNINLIHALGHGVGLETHEAPIIHTNIDVSFKENMIIAIEPAVYFPSNYGIRIEDTVLVTKTGCISLTKSNKNYIVI